MKKKLQLLWLKVKKLFYNDTNPFDRFVVEEIPPRYTIEQLREQAKNKELEKFIKDIDNYFDLIGWWKQKQSTETELWYTNGEAEVYYNTMGFDVPQNRFLIQVFRKKFSVPTLDQISKGTHSISRILAQYGVVKA